MAGDTRGLFRTSHSGLAAFPTAGHLIVVIFNHLLYGSTIVALELLGSIQEIVSRSITIAVAVLAISVVAGVAQERILNTKHWTQNLYSEIDLGGVYQQENTTLYQSTGNPLTATFNLGLRGNIVLGYDISKSLAVEFDTGVLWNSMNKVGGTSLNAIGQSFDTYTVPFLATVIYKIPTGRSWYPYLGIGVGGAATMASYNLGTVGNWTSSTYSDYSFVFACQAEAGLEYKFTKNFSADVAYQFLAATDPSWRYTISVAGGPATDYQFKEKGFYTHAFVLSLTWHF